MDKSQEQFNNIKVAIVHDFLDTYGGAERVLEAICEIFPKAPIYTLLYDKEKMRNKFQSKEIHTSFLQKFPKFIKKRKKYLLPLMPTAPETFDLRDFDLVISSSGAWTKGIVTRLSTKHICYMHSPMRFVWDYNEKYLNEIGKKSGFCKRAYLSYLRIWDYEAAQRPDLLIANSNYTRQRINKYYRRDCEIVYPVTILPKQENKETIKDKNYFLIISRLAAYKKIDLVVEAFNKMDLPLIIIGEGEEKEKIKKMAKKNIKILGWKSDAIIGEYYKNARAFICPAVEDFGLTMIEAMSYGVPVIALEKGGAKEIIKEGITGEFFKAQTIEVLADGVRRFMEREDSYDREIINNEAQKFSREKFKSELTSIIEREIANK
ncbi:MAG: glycosyltransferase [Parcubacteria group bacterium]|jgi:glycosyltransferase involved in cell wall biosynthesis